MVRSQRSSAPRGQGDQVRSKKLIAGRGAASRFQGQPRRQSGPTTRRSGGPAPW
jgi:hypothetical protein